jgi:hypothetical protein
MGIYVEKRSIKEDSSTMSIMSIEEARKILGDDESADLSDDQLEGLLQDLEAIASMTIQSIMKGEFKPDKQSFMG